MNLELSSKEKIELLINLFTPPRGYRAESIGEFPEAIKFLQADCLELDESNNIFYSNDRGSEYLHCFIKDITEKLIHDMKQNAWSMDSEKLLPWFADNYDLQNDIETAEILQKYIAFVNLNNYGYDIYLSKTKNKYFLELL